MRGGGSLVHFADEMSTSVLLPALDGTGLCAVESPRGGSVAAMSCDLGSSKVVRGKVVLLPAIELHHRFYQLPHLGGDFVLHQEALTRRPCDSPIRIAILIEFAQIMRRTLMIGVNKSVQFIRGDLVGAPGIDLRCQLSQFGVNSRCKPGPSSGGSAL